VYVVGLTGGIGTGKSTVASMLSRLGAVVIDADALAREVVEPGTPGYDELVQEFGEGVVSADGTLNRAAIASIVFSDDEARARLNAIVHPKVYERIALRMQELAGSDAVVVLDVPLLFESSSGSRGLVSEVVVVAASDDVALDRLEGRGVGRHDAESRMAAQLPIAEKVAAADVVIHNDGTLDELEAQVDELWERLRGKA
jgi:dephospho-CoA kinase